MLNVPMLAGKKILVSGGSGFIGGHLLPKLVANGADVFCLARSPASGLPDGVTAIKGDCTDAATVAAAVRGKDLVVHMAGLLFGAGWRDYLAANTAYASNMVAAVQAEPMVQKLVFVSSLAASGPSATMPGRRETDTPGPVSAYGWSKLAAEGLMRSGLGRRRLCILRPPVVYGSGDHALLPVFKSCKRGLGITPAGDFPLSMIHASDVANAIMLALGPEAGPVYHLGDGARYSMSSICSEIGKSLGRKKTIIARMPGWLLGAAAMAGSGLNLLLSLRNSGRKRFLAWNWDKFREARQPGWLADGSLISQELGFRPEYDLKAGIAETLAGYRRDGWL